MRHLLVFLLLAAWGTASGAVWREASGRHFIIYSEQSEADLRRYAEQLERFDGVLRRQLRRPDPDQGPATRLTVYVLHSQQALQDFIGARNVAGIYFGRASGSIAFTSQDRERFRVQGSRELSPRIVLFHEYTHHFLFNNFSFGAPLWFSEGYPEFWSTADFDDNEGVRFGLPAWHRNAEITLARPMQVRELLTLRYPIRDGETFAVAYGRGWLLTHYLVFDPARAGQLDAYLRAIAEGQSAEQAAAAFGDLDQLDRDLQRYLDRPSFSYATVPADQIATAPIAIRTLNAAEQAIMEVRMQTKRGVRPGADAARLASRARRVAAPYPDDPLVQVTLAEIELDANNFDEAEAAADRALAATPNMVDAHLFKGRAIWGRISAAGNATPEQWGEVRRWIASGNRLDPDDPEPLVLFYQSYVAAGLTPPANAVDGLLYAYELAREDRSLRLAVGRQLLASGKGDQARAVLAVVMGDSHSGSIGNEIAQVLATLASDGTAAALARLDAALAAQRRENEMRMPIAPESLFQQN